MTGDILVTCPCLPVHLPTGQVRSWSRLPGRAVPLAPPAPAASSACVHWTLTLLVRAGPSLSAWGGVIWLPQGSLKPSLLQTVPRLLGLSPPHISPRCCLLRLGYLPPPAVVQGRVRPRAATGELAGGKTLPVSCPMDRGGGGRKIVALNRVQMRPGTQVQFCFYRGDAQACVIEQLCYGCRVNMKDMVSACPYVPMSCPYSPHGSSHCCLL